MRSRSLPIAALVCALATAFAGSVHAHSLLDQPAPRDQQDGYKDESPCGVGFDAAQPLTTYAPGQAVNVRWLETVDHPGCFLVEFSAGGDQDFQILGRLSHSNPPLPEMASTAEPRHWSLDVTLPATACSGCTLRLRQLMMDADVTADACSAVNAPPRSIYTTCANVALEGGGSAGSAAVTPAATDSGCSLGPARDVSLAPALVLGAALATQVLRRRKHDAARRSAQA
ncbi:MAG TPA: SCE4755 family polysaccharide monooxygenase-like protein [Polyangiaceae bacterium]|nr:SCE4755 family polysaccharide monooxygenase-like protein [Polyangiaceae bacterium]